MPQVRKSATDLEAAEQALELAHADPRLARKQALLLATTVTDTETLSVVQRALGMAAKELNMLEDAHDHLLKAVKLAQAAGSDRRAAQARMSHSLVLLELGKTKDALAEIERAAGHLRGQEAGLLEMQRSLILQRLGRLDEALIGYRRALAVFRRHGDILREARLRINRAAVHTYRGDLSSAEADLKIASHLARQLDQYLLQGGAAHNLGFVRARRHQVPDALRAYDEAEEAYMKVAADRLRAVLATDRAELLLAVGLTAEAKRQAGIALQITSRGANRADAAEALLLSARAELADNNPRPARDAARQAQSWFRAQGRHVWASYARFTALQAQVALSQDLPGRPPRRLLQQSREVAAELEQSGWKLEGRAARLIAGRVAVARGETTEARSDLVRLRSASQKAPIEVQVGGWHATGLLRIAEGNVAGAKRALIAGLRLVERYRATLGSNDLRAGVSMLGVGLARTGLRLAMQQHRPLDALAWTEANRAAALSYPEVRPPSNRGLAGLLTELRQVVSEANEARLSGADASRLEQRRFALERRIRDAARGASGRGPVISTDLLTHLPDLLGDRLLLSYFVVDQRLHAIRLHRGRLHLVELAPISLIAEEATSMAFSLHRLSISAGSEASLAAAANALRQSARAVSELIFRPLAVNSGPPVIVPTGSLHGLPWNALDGLEGTPFTVAPSARLWARAASNPVTVNPDSRAALIAGPGLPGAASEVNLLARRYRHAIRATGRAATVERVLHALDGAIIAHLAAHGSLRRDNPLFSSLTMADGPLTVYDLDQLQRAPAVVVMPSCETALSEVWVGDEIMGLSAALLRMGVSCLVAPVATIPDEATKTLMLALHRRLIAGDSPSEALTRATAGLPADTPQQLAVKTAFVPLGA